MSYEPRGILTARKRPHSATSSSTASPVSNRLLAGYMAYEFLEKGTLFGHRFEAEGAPDLKRSRKEAVVEAEAEEANYFEVASLVKSQGVHVAGVVNPTQLARWIHQR